MTQGHNEKKKVQGKYNPTQNFSSIGLFLGYRTA